MIQELRPSLKVLSEKSNLVGCEVGVDSGENALSMLTYLNIKKLYLIDPWMCYDHMQGHGVISNSETALKCMEYAKKILAPFEDKLVWLRGLSENMAVHVRDPLDFAYVDGNHRYPYVLQDIALFYPKIKIGGLIAGHDFKKIYRLQVVKAVNDYFYPLQKMIRVEDWDWSVEK